MMGELRTTTLAISLLFAGYVAISAEVVRDSIDSKMLAGNLLGDSAKREVLVYLPPFYKTSGMRYPVVYLLHSYGVGPDS